MPRAHRRRCDLGCGPWRGDVEGRRARTASVLVPGLPLVLVSGCGADVERQQARAVADAFAADVSTDPEAACERLAPETGRTLEQDGESCPAGAGR